MSDHWFVPLRSEDVTPLDPHIDRLFDRTLSELARKPDMNLVIASTKAWSRETWFTSDGKEFYLRDHGAPHNQAVKGCALMYYF
jgi:hypothetical protein